jgi:glutathione S-transferase
MILVGQFDSPFVRRVAVTLHLYGMPFTRNAISVFTDAAEMARINPLVRIPSLVLDSGETLIDSAAILGALDEMVGPDRALSPPSGAARRRVLQATAMATGAIDKARVWVYERHFQPPGQRSKTKLARYETQLAGALSWLDAQIRDGCLCGPTRSQAGVTAAVLVFYLKLRVVPAFSELMAWENFRKPISFRGARLAHWSRSPWSNSEIETPQRTLKGHGEVEQRSEIPYIRRRKQRNDLVEVNRPTVCVDLIAHVATIAHVNRPTFLGFPSKLTEIRSCPLISVSDQFIEQFGRLRGDAAFARPGPVVGLKSARKADRATSQVAVKPPKSWPTCGRCLPGPNRCPRQPR